MWNMHEDIIFFHIVFREIRNILFGPQGKNLSSGVCEQHRRRPACASAQSDQRLCYSLISAFVIRFVESITCQLTTGEISIF